MEFDDESVECGLGTSTKIGVPVKADKGRTPDTVFGAVNVVGIETHVFPLQYFMTLADVKLGFVMVTVTETLELKLPLLDVTLMS